MQRQDQQKRFVCSAVAFGSDSPASVSLCSLSSRTNSLHVPPQNVASAFSMFHFPEPFASPAPPGQRPDVEHTHEVSKVEAGSPPPECRTHRVNSTDNVSDELRKGLFLMIFTEIHCFKMVRLLLILELHRGGMRCVGGGFHRCHTQTDSSVCLELNIIPSKTMMHSELTVWLLHQRERENKQATTTTRTCWPFFFSLQVQPSNSALLLVLKYVILKYEAKGK